jgi:LEA14-like dessication related protein
MLQSRWLAAMLCTLAALAGCAGFPGRMEPLSVTLADIRPTQIGLFEQEYAVKLRVQNPNNQDIPLEGVSFAVELNGKSFAKGVSRQTGTVPAFSDVVLDVTAISSLSGILEQLGALRTGAPDRIEYRLQGRLTPSSGSSVPFDSTGTLDLSGFTGSDTQ